MACPLRWIANPNYRGLYLRREAQYLGDAVDKTKRLYPALGARLVMGPRILWTFPSGAELWMNHCAHESDIANYDSFEFSEVLFDELTHFTERQFTGICARLRGTDPTLPYWSRAATNPGGVGHDWVKSRWAAWLNPKHPAPAEAGETRWMLRGAEVPAGTPRATSYTFIPALLDDNPKVDASYRAQLEDLDPVRRAQLIQGDWDAAYGEGKLFHRDWWVHFDAAPDDIGPRCRAWDLGATVDGDPSRGVLLGRRPREVTPRWAVLDVATVRGAPHEVEALILATAARDGRDVTVCLPQDPGQAGLAQVQYLTRKLDGYRVEVRRPSEKKVTRWGPISSQVGARNVGLVRAPWTAAVIAEGHAAPDGPNDDILDALADAHSVLADVGEGDSEGFSRGGRRR